MDQNGKDAAAKFVEQRLSELRRDERWLADETELDPGTIADFLNGQRWPRTTTRNAIEDALELDRGKIRDVARDWDRPDEGDPVDAAIDASPNLTKAQKLRLRAFYAEMLEEGEVRGA